MSKLDIKFKRLTPFKRCVLQNFPFIEEDFDALTNYGLLCKIVAYLNKVIESQNEVQGVTEEIVTAFNNLYDYVKNFFDNLDVQDEIDHKLDEMAEDGTLQQYVDEYLAGLTDEVKYCFPKNWNNGAYGTGDVSLILAGGKSVLIDTSYNPFKTNLYEFLADYSVSKLDYVIISHFDVDHCGNFENLVNDGYIDENTTIYLPPYVNYLANLPDSLAEYNKIIACLNNAGFTYTNPVEGSKVNITDTFSITFFNCDQAYLNTNPYVRYNNYSMICLCEHLGNRVLYTGDCNKEPLEKLIYNGSITSNIDLYKIEHHGLEFGINYTPTWLLKNIKPKYAWLPANMVFKDKCSRSITISYLESFSTDISAQFNNSQNTEYISNFNSLNQVKGKVLPSISNAIAEVIYHVNPSTTNAIRNGTSNYPFKEVKEAFGAVNSNEKATINLADGEYSDNTGGFGGNSSYLVNRTVIVNGNSSDKTAVVINGGIKIANSNLTLNNLTVAIETNNVAIIASDSKVKLENCVVKGLSGSTIGTGIDATDCEIYINASEVKDLNAGIDNRQGYAKISGTAFSDVNVVNFNRNGVEFIGNTNTFTNVTTRYTLTSTNVGFFMNPNTIFTGSADGEQDITLQDSITEYSNLTIQIGGYSTGAWTEYHVTSQNSLFAVNDKFTVPTLNGNGLITVKDATTLTIDMPINSWIRAIYASREVTRG